MAVFVPRKPPTDLQCKTEFFICLVAPSTNMYSTSVLSTYQFVTLVPGNWVRLLLLGVLNNVYIPMKVSGPQSTNNGTSSKSKWVCSTSAFGIGMVSIWYARDAMLISIMAWTSVSMVLFLHRHHQRLQHIFTPNQGHRHHPETRAAHTILMLVGTFVSFYVLDCICIFFHVSFVDSGLWLRHVKQVLSAAFLIISPFLLIFRDPKDPCSVIFSY
ncbi:hypothetical protein A6R68_21852 [Neotoma lepida]|uniref:Vomeronasal type-1 receptor n=1 Tax=Neotoma lepida TaxID=56216 RepID=A0A1A6HND7_NEOLE|nr:hypothetical protein A6R68_21852 [Neotoma lepida]